MGEEESGVVSHKFQRILVVIMAAMIVTVDGMSGCSVTNVICLLLMPISI